VGARRAGCAGRERRAAEAVFHGDVAGGEVNEEAGDEERGDPAVALCKELWLARSLFVVVCRGARINIRQPSGRVWWTRHLRDCRYLSLC
jgi:hypothetical protein